MLPLVAEQGNMLNHSFCHIFKHRVLEYLRGNTSLEKWAGCYPISCHCVCLNIVPGNTDAGDEGRKRAGLC